MALCSHWGKTPCSPLRMYAPAIPSADLRERVPLPGIGRVCAVFHGEPVADTPGQPDHAPPLSGLSTGLDPPAGKAPAAK